MKIRNLFRYVPKLSFFLHRLYCSIYQTFRPSYPEECIILKIYQRHVEVLYVKNRLLKEEYKFSFSDLIHELDLLFPWIGHLPVLCVIFHEDIEFYSRSLASLPFLDRLTAWYHIHRCQVKEGYLVKVYKEKAHYKFITLCLEDSQAQLLRDLSHLPFHIMGVESSMLKIWCYLRQALDGTDSKLYKDFRCFLVNFGEQCYILIEQEGFLVLARHVVAGANLDQELYTAKRTVSKNLVSYDIDFSITTINFDIPPDFPSFLDAMVQHRYIPFREQFCYPKPLSLLSLLRKGRCVVKSACIPESVVFIPRFFRLHRLLFIGFYTTARLCVFIWLCLGVGFLSLSFFQSQAERNYEHIKKKVRKKSLGFEEEEKFLKSCMYETLKNVGSENVMDILKSLSKGLSKDVSFEDIRFDTFSNKRHTLTFSLRFLSKNLNISDIHRLEQKVYHAIQVFQGVKVEAKKNPLGMTFTLHINS